MQRARVLRAAAVLIFAAAGLGLMNSFAPLQWPSVLAYSGLVILLFGFVSIFLPPAWLGLSRRVSGLLLGLLIGCGLLAAAMAWPARRVTIASPSTRLDAFMPAYQFAERHEITIHASPLRVRDALNQTSFADIGVMQTLGRIRAIAMRSSAPASNAARGASPALPIVEMVKQPRSGFFPLEDTPNEFVFGLAGQPWNNIGYRLTPEEFLAWGPPGNVKIAANFRIEDAGSGASRVITETRIAGSDPSAVRLMTRYWAFIYPGSGMIRRSLLRAVRERAERQTAPTS